MNPANEKWAANAEMICLDGEPIFLAIESIGLEKQDARNEVEARVKLAAQAPVLAKLLLQVWKDNYPHRENCELHLALIEAGVLPP